MPKRYNIKSRMRSGKRLTRKQRKDRFIRVKNRVARHPTKMYHSYHVEGELMSWIDLSFLSERHKNRYFACALITLEYDALDKHEESAFEESSALFPNASIEMVPGEKTKFGRYMSIKTNADWEAQSEWKKAKVQELSSKPMKLKPYIKIDRTYFDPAIGFHAAVNTKTLSPSAICELIKHFREMGEPISHGIVWEGEEVDVVAEELTNRFNANAVKSGGY